MNAASLIPFICDSDEMVCPLSLPDDAAAGVEALAADFLSVPVAVLEDPVAGLSAAAVDGAAAEDDAEAGALAGEAVLAVADVVPVAV